MNNLTNNFEVPLEYFPGAVAQREQLVSTLETTSNVSIITAAGSTVAALGIMGSALLFEPSSPWAENAINYGVYGTVGTAVLGLVSYFVANKLSQNFSRSLGYNQWIAPSDFRSEIE